MNFDIGSREKEKKKKILPKNFPILHWNIIRIQIYFRQQFNAYLPIHFIMVGLNEKHWATGLI